MEGQLINIEDAMDEVDMMKDLRKICKKFGLVPGENFPYS